MQGFGANNSCSFSQKARSYLREKKAFSVSPVQAAATASTKVEMPKVAWMGTKEALKDAVADSQHSSRMKLKKPTTNCKETLFSSCTGSY